MVSRQAANSDQASQDATSDEIRRLAYRKAVGHAAETAANNKAMCGEESCHLDADLTFQLC